MDVVKTIRPGERGSQRFLAEWGERLIAVRYRKGNDGNTMLTTIEVVVDERAYHKGIGSHAAQAARRDEPVALRIPGRKQSCAQK